MLTIVYFPLQVGYHVVTAFTLASTGQRVLVNRGWVPQSRGQQSTRMAGQVSRGPRFLDWLGFPSHSRY